MIIVSPKFRSERSYRIYHNVLKPQGIGIQCVPTADTKSSENWWHTWHGIQEVFLEYSKLLYYRVCVL